MSVVPFVAPKPEPAGLWPDPTPLPSTLPDVPTFDRSLLPSELRPWVVDIAERMQCPLDFAAIPAMVAAGSLIGRRVGIRPESKTDWTEVANLWGCIIGRPGAMKSPVISEVLGPIRRMEAKAATENEEALSKFRKAETAHKLQFDAARARAKKQFESGDISLAELTLDEIEEPKPPIERRYVATDATVEKLGVICKDNPSGLLLYRDELLTMFQELDREEKAAARGFMLTGWSGRDGYTFDRIARGTVRVPAVNLSVIGSAQPHRIGTYLRESLRTHDDGMVQRLQLLTWPDYDAAWLNTDRYPDADAKAAAFACYERLATLTPAMVGTERDAFDDGDGVPFLRFAPEAVEQFVQWRGYLEERVRGDELPPYLAAHLSKYRGLVPRLALIFHLASGGIGPVTKRSCVEAIGWAEYLEAHACRAYAQMSLVNTDVAASILRRIKKGDLQSLFTERDVYRPGWSGLKDREGISAALKLLADYDWLRAQKLEMEFEHVDRILAGMAGTPAAANNLRKVPSRLMDYAVRIRMASRNPVRGVRKFKTNPEGWHPWTDEEIEKYEQRHPLGTKARLALALLLHTGQRRSDVVRMGRQHIRNGKISLTQQKTRASLVLPVHSELAKAIAAMPRHEHLTFLVTSFGKPFTKEGFGNWFRDRCDEAGLSNCSAHGLRKAFTRRLVYAGLTHAQGKALTGHATDAEFNRYARHANQEQLAEEGMANLEARLAKKVRKTLKEKQKT